MKKIGFIGVGNMATQIINGLSASDLDIKLFGFNHNHVNEHVADLTKRNVITMTSDVNQLVQECDYIIFAVRVDKVEMICKQINPELINDQKVFMSVAAGITLNDYENFLGSQVKFIRVMPNVNAAVKQSMTALCENKNVTKEELNFGEELFKQVGKTIVIPENQFDIFMSIAGSFPAMVFMMIDALSKVAEEHGMDKSLATQIAIQTIAGSTEYAKQQNKEMPELISSVATPGGTTEKGVKVFEKENFDKLIKETIEAMMK